MVLDDVYRRLHQTGPEFRGRLSNHGPMAAEAMIRHGHGDGVQHWLDWYVRRLEPFPSGLAPIGADWREGLGDPRRIADWTRRLEREVAERPWPVVLNQWWPRLLPGITAGATHGVIRVGHAVRVLLTDGDSPARVAELAHGLAYWAARWRPVSRPAALAEDGFENPDVAPFGTETLADGLAAIPRVAHPDGGFDSWLERIGDVPGWDDALLAVSIPREPESARDWLAHLVDVATIRYLWRGHGDAIMLVHSVTAPHAVWRILPALDRRWWQPSALAAWIAVAALTAVYTPPTPADAELLPRVATGGEAAQEAFARAADHADEHVIKFADSALDVYDRTHDPQALAAVYRAAALIRPVTG